MSLLNHHILSRPLGLLPWCLFSGCLTVKSSIAGPCPASRTTDCLQRNCPQQSIKCPSAEQIRDHPWHGFFRSHGLPYPGQRFDALLVFLAQEVVCQRPGYARPARRGTYQLQLHYSWQSPPADPAHEQDSRVRRLILVVVRFGLGSAAVMNGILKSPGLVTGSGGSAYRSHLVYISSSETWSSVVLCMYETKLFLQGFPHLRAGRWEKCMLSEGLAPETFGTPARIQPTWSFPKTTGFEFPAAVVAPFL